MTMRHATRILLPLALTGGIALAQTGGPGFRDISRIDPTGIRVLEAADAPPVVREPERRLLPSEAPSSPDPSLGRPLAQLALDGSALLDRPFPRGLAEVTAAPLIEFRLAGNDIRMLGIEVRADADFDALHMTLVAIESDDYARLTISRTGPEIVGSVSIDNGWYRILPDDFDNEYQLVYPVGVRESPWQRSLPPNFATRNGALEARHLQMAWAAETQPEIFSTHSDGRPEEYRGPTLGVLDFWDSLFFDSAGVGTVDESLLAQETARFLTEAQRFTWVYDRIDVELEPRFESDLNTITNEGFDIVAYQLINDIPVSRPLRLKISPTGDVIEYAGSLVSPDFGGAFGGPRVLKDEARATVEAALRSAYGIETTGEFLEEQIFYNQSDDASLELIWRMSVQAICGVDFTVDVDGFSGEVLRTSISSTERLEERFPFGRRRPSTEELMRLCRFTVY